ncbi:ABC transporter ATP-binding protein [Tenacibaculum jejuense]|uniref:Glutathione import ATP-binding protein GsiA n=1 Tax=Tenacibaculum jejuense TaxID=584609 RepID=A0A238U4A8_9FLAO|nr:ABC transporter ATP-binding protein [Tenacibaculum jejuense]SNR13856.1 Glutathione import ATP-binding protein GsiA [Tenacibaculum jejuense]
MVIFKDFSISFKGIKVINNLNFKIKSNSILGIVGESGSGKSLTSLALIGLLPKTAKVSGKINFLDTELFSLSEKEFQKYRGKEISMIFQEPMSSLNPTITCGKQVAEILSIHTKLSKQEIREEVTSLFEKVKLPRPKHIYDSFPHEISGGQKQRVMIAMAIACKPKLLIADEPTTALDVTVQKEIILLLKNLQLETQMSILFISHDLNLVSEIADDVLVMYKGEIVEYGNTTSVFKNPKENYTKALINSKPKENVRLKKLPTVKDFINETVENSVFSKEERKVYHEKIYSTTPFLEVKNLKKEFISKSFLFTKPNVVKAVNDVSFSLYQGETLGLVGESGCGKSTLVRTILQLEKATNGEIFYQGKDITKLNTKELKLMRKDIQIIFQDPFSSLNPRKTVGEAILEPMTVHKILSHKKERKDYVLELFKNVGLDVTHYDRYPHEFSGGQRQRIGIARAIALQPKLLICDESVSALDVSIQAQILNLLNELKLKYNFTYIFISHDLSVVKYMSDQLIVMNAGQIEEIGDADEIYTNPKKEYTKTLISAIPKGI